MSYLQTFYIKKYPQKKLINLLASRKKLQNFWLKFFFAYLCSFCINEYIEILQSY